jgi:twinkle protein
VADRAGAAVHVAPYHDAAGRLVAQKIRTQEKSFSWVGNQKAATLFGQHLWRPGRRVIVTEGEIDAMSVSQAQGNRWPAVSIRGGAQHAAKEVAAAVEWLEGFEAVVFAFDSDEHGVKAAAECAAILTPGKAFLARLPRKDANEMLVAGETKELVQALWQAAPYRPEGIVSGLDLIDKALAPPPPSLDYPWTGLTTMLRGQRRGEITTWCAGTGAGKSQLCREVIHGLHRSGCKVGLIALEESAARAALQQVSITMNRRLHDPGVRNEVDDEEIKAAARQALLEVWFYESFGSVEVDVLLPKLRYMVKALGVEWVVIDHISIMVSGNATEGDERKRLDELMTKLRTFVEETGIGMHIVSHLRKASGTPHEEGGRITLDDLRGSGAIKQISDNIIAAERDQQDAFEEQKHRTMLRVLKCRLFGDTCECAAVIYSKQTGRLTETALQQEAFTSSSQPTETEGEF